MHPTYLTATERGVALKSAAVQEQTRKLAELAKRRDADGGDGVASATAEATAGDAKPFGDPSSNGQRRVEPGGWRGHLLAWAELASLVAQRRVLDGELSEALRVKEQRSEEMRRARAALEAERARRQHLQEVLEQQLEGGARA